MLFADPFAEAVCARLLKAGYSRCEPPILQPAEIFFDSGEELRAQLYLTSDLSGADYCLRPEYTIPVLAAYLESWRAGEIAAFCYCGPVFRFRPGERSEFVQAGIESFGRSDQAAADAEILALSLSSVPRELTVRIGDAGLFARLLEALDLAPQWRRRIARGHSHGKTLDTILGSGPRGTDHSGVLSMLEGADQAGARALVEDLLSIAGIAVAGGRTAGEIAERFLEQAALKAGSGLPPEKRAIIEAFLCIEDHPERASERLWALARREKLDLAASLDLFDARLAAIAAQGLALAKLQFSTRLTRNLDYYTGFVFEACAEGAAEPVIGGGRYDGLPQALGAKQPIPAVGAAIWIDRLTSTGAHP
ncbi:MAG TPA: ATP phosphoribosyltransferase regulatory subunit [Methylocella sp.]|nr:ATP phosphoribosyltransferase regulatory subunit [Methylocella sp.]